jgi:dTDP-4-amino-4,6-dideoxygalactose transaminase
MNIPMVNLQAQYADIKIEIQQQLNQVLDNCQFILGSQGQAFEQEVAEYLGVQYAIGVASGTDALHLALLAEGIGKGDEVITTAFTFIATAEAICYVGAKPVFVDINPNSFNLSIEAIEAAITPKTKAILPVHLFGQPANMIALQQLCQHYQLKLIEDCAQSFGAKINGKYTGNWGNSAGFSFFPSKNLGAFGDGGLITTDSAEIAATIKSLRNHGSKIRYYHEQIGFNSRLDEIQASILRIKLKRIDQYNQARRRAAHLYSDLLADLPIITPIEDHLGEHVYHQYTLLSPQRAQIMAALQQQNIASAIYYPVPLHKQKLFQQDYQSISLPITEKVASQCLSLPICSHISDEQIHQIAKIIHQVFN